MLVRPRHVASSYCAGVLALTSCAYRPGSFANGSGPFPATRTTIDCLDLAVGLVGEAHKPGPVLQFNFGNRCTHPIPLDLTAIRVIARDETGFERPLMAHDPRRELRPLQLEAGLSAQELIEFRDPYGAFFSGAAPAICVDLGRVTRTPSPVEVICLVPPPEVRR